MTKPKTVTEILDSLERQIALVFDADKGEDRGQHVSCLTPRQRMVLEDVVARVIPLARHAAELVPEVLCERDASTCLDPENINSEETWCIPCVKAAAVQKTISKIEGG